MRRDRLLQDQREKGLPPKGRKSPTHPSTIPGLDPDPEIHVEAKE